MEITRKAKSKIIYYIYYLCAIILVLYLLLYSDF